MRNVHGVACLCEGHALAVEDCVEARGSGLGADEARAGCWETAEGEDGDVFCRDDVDVVARAPELD